MASSFPRAIAAVLVAVLGLIFALVLALRARPAEGIVTGAAPSANAPSAGSGVRLDPMRTAVAPRQRREAISAARWSVHGMVLDAVTRAPVATALRAYARPGPALSSALSSDVATESGVDGVFRFATDFAPGRYWLATIAGPWIVDGREFEVAAAAEPAALVVLVAAAGDDDSISGRVLDVADRRPLADVVVQGWGEGLVHGFSDAEGRFALFASAPTRGPVALSIDKCWRGRPRQGFPYQLDAGPVITEWGARNVEVLLRRASPFVVRVVDQAGQPVETFAAAVVAMGGNGGGGLPLAIGAHSGGVQTFDCVADDQLYALLVVPGAGDLFPAPPRRIERTHGQPSEVTVRVAPRRAVGVRCVDAHGLGVAGVRVSVLAHLPYPLQVPGLPGLPIEGLQDVTCQTLAYAESVSDAEGRAALRVPNPTADLVWRLEGPGACFEEHAADGVRERGGELVFVIASGGTLRVRAEGIETDEMTVSLLRADAPANATALRLPVPTRSRWAFEAGLATVTGIPAGMWHVEVDGHDVDPVPIGTIDVRDGGVHDLRLDAARLRREAVQGRVVCDGAPLADLRIVVDGPTSGRALEAITDARGEFRLDDVPHGRLQLGGFVDGVDGRGALPLGSVEVAAGGARDLVFAIRRVRQVVRLVDARARPLAGLRVVVLDAEERERWRATSDDAGFVTLDWLPARGRLVTSPGDWNVRKWQFSPAERATPWRDVLALDQLAGVAPRGDVLVR